MASICPNADMAKRNQKFVRDLLKSKQPEYARALERARSDVSWDQVLRERRSAAERDGTWAEEADAYSGSGGDGW